MFDEAKRTFNECQSVEVASRNQIIKTIVPEFLQPLRDAVTEILNDNIPDIFTFGHVWITIAGRAKGTRKTDQRYAIRPFSRHRHDF